MNQEPSSGAQGSVEALTPLETSAPEPESRRSIRTQDDVLARLDALPPGGLRQLSDRMDATLREVSSVFSDPRLARSKGWDCDLIPHIFGAEEWDMITRAFDQRLRAFEQFLADIYGSREILRAGAVPISAALGSPAILREAAGLAPLGGGFLHFCAMRIGRNRAGELRVKCHHFSRATGISYMIQNRRVLSRVDPELFEQARVASIADAPLQILESLTALSRDYPGDVPPVLLSDGPASPVYAEHSFLARRMGLLLVQGQDLVVLENRLYLKTLRGLERVGVIYNRIPDEMLDPLALRRDSRIGVPGLLHCIRQGTVALVNAPGAQLADDRSLLSCADQICRFYLGEPVVMPSHQTWWLADADVRELVLERPEKFRIRPVFGERVLGSGRPGSLSAAEIRTIRRELRVRPEQYVAQPADDGEAAVCIERGQKRERRQDHMVFALRSGERFIVLPSALTRIAGPRSELIGVDHGGGYKDSWVIVSESTPQFPIPHHHEEPPAAVRCITSRVADGFYWLGRYLERGVSVASMLDVVVALEAEELNAEERKLFDPIWTTLLPRLESKKPRHAPVRSVQDRYALLLDASDPQSVVSALNKAFSNAGALRDSLSGQAWNVIDDLRREFERKRFRTDLSPGEASRRSRRLREAALHRIPEFFMVAQDTLLADDGWRFCQLGRYLERALVTGHASAAIMRALERQTLRDRSAENAAEIQLSVFLRLLGCRDVYRRIFQSRARREHVLELLWQHREAPQSVACCLDQCIALLRSPSIAGAPNLHPTLEAFLGTAEVIAAENFCKSGDGAAIATRLQDLVREVRRLNAAIADSFLSHQGTITATSRIVA